MNTKIAIIDVIGLPYDGDTLNHRGLGGSESAIILMSRELQRLGFDVTVFNNCTDTQAKEGVYQGVKFVDIQRLAESNNYTADVVISSRTIIPFSPAKYWGQLRYDCARYQKLVASAKLKVLWMHDTFCWGDEHLEELLVEGYIDEIFTLSDFHTAYVTNCHHGRRRNFEVLKNRVFITRNGAVRYRDWVDISRKDRNLFVYNASLTKGLVPLLEKVWPRVKQAIPQAQLKVIGGYYQFKANTAPDEQEQRLRAYASDPRYAELGVEFTGIIKQQEIADILCAANFMIFPAAFPETFGISSLESLLYNTPILTCRFGALEETAIERACYLLDYAIEPNGLFPDIDSDAQVERFVAMTVQAYNNPYLHQQKQHACRIVHDVAGWDTVALQWKQHFCRKLKLFLPLQEYRRVSEINSSIHQVFGRRYSNPEEWSTTKNSQQQRIAVVSPFYNSAQYLERCIQSVAQQDYDNYHLYLIDDCSTDNSVEVISRVVSELPEHMDGKITLIQNEINQGAVYNQVSVIRDLQDDDIVMLLDGDDWLVNEPDIFHYYNNLYHEGTEFSYGSCWSLADNIPLVAQTYPPEVKKNRSYRTHHFNWILPYTHLRTFRKKLINRVDDAMFKDDTGQWFKAGGDGAVFYALIEQAKPDRITAISRIVYNYNDLNPLNDYKVNGELQNQNARAITKLVQKSKTAAVEFVIPEPPKTVAPSKNTASALSMLQEMGILPKESTATSKVVTSTPAIEPVASVPAITNPTTKKRILIAIPTAKNIEVETFKSIYDLEIPEGYEVDFRYSFGYRIDQIRNLIAHWAANWYDYLFSVDSDISFPPDTLKRLLAHDRDIVSGLYIQRIPGTHALEIYLPNQQGGMTRAEYSQLPENQLINVAGCGFGCVLVKSEVFRAVGYPQFEYHVALDHNNTVSEDTDFCAKAMAKGFKIYADTSVKCKHTGSYTYTVGELTKQQPVAQIPTLTPIQRRLVELRAMPLFPKTHSDYLHKIKQQFNYTPKVIYDIGACVLHWTDAARQVWPDSEYIAFEAMPSTEFIYQKEGMRYHMGLLGYQNNLMVDFYHNEEHPGGNSYYRENEKINPVASELYKPVPMKMITLDSVVAVKNFPLPDLVKIDVQGADMDVLIGGKETIKHCQHLIIELQHVEYNVGAPNNHEVIEYIQSLGFQLVGEKFSYNMGDADYHFVRR